MKPMDKVGHDISNEIAAMLDDSELKNAAARLKKNRAKEKPKPLRVIENTVEDSVEPKTTLEKTEAPKSKGPADSPQKAKTLDGHPTVEKSTRKKPKRDGEGERKVKKEISWSRPTAILNTRIPPELDDMLDDYIQEKRKTWKSNARKGPEPTKQSVVFMALDKLLT